MKSESISKDEYIVGIVFLIALFLPHTSTMLLLINPLLCLWLGYHYATIKKYRSDKIKYLLIGSIAFSLLLNSIVGLASSKSILTTVNLLLMLLLFPFVTDVRIRNVFLYIAIIYVIVSQITMFVNVPAISSFYEALYPLTEENGDYYQYVLSTANSGNISGYRLAGLFRNPNQCSKYVTLITAVFLLDSKIPFIKSLHFLGIAAFSVIMTGSRTGLVVFMTLIFVSLFLKESVSKTSKHLSIVLLVFLAAVLLNMASDFRGLRVDDGLNDSANSKFGAVIDYLSHEFDLIYFLFGHLDQYLFVASSDLVHPTLDCEYGNMIFNYGFIGFTLYIIFFCRLYKNFSKSERLIFVPMLWIISASMLLAYRSLFLYMLLLSKYYITSKKSSNGCKQ